MTDQDAIETGVFHRSGQKVETPKCAIPVCGLYTLPEAKNGVCPECEILIHKILWILDHVKRDESEPPDPRAQKGALYIPKPGMEKAAIREALEKGGAIGIKNGRS